MKILLFCPYGLSEPTFKIVFEGLAAPLRRQGHDVRLSGGSAGARGLWEDVGWADFAHAAAGNRVNSSMLMFWAACVARRRRYGISFHSFTKQRRACHYPFPAWKWRLHVGLVGRILSGAEWIGAPSRFCGAELAAAFPWAEPRLKVVHWGFDAVARPVPPAGDRPLVLCVSRLAPYKGIDILLAAWAGVLEKRPDAELAICGADESGGHYQDLARRLGLKARFLGVVSRERLWQLFAQARVFVLASRCDAAPMAVLEAMSFGKAVLATRSGGAEDFIEDGETGLLAPAENVAALRDGLLRLLEDAALCRRLGQRARAAAAPRTWEATARDYWPLYSGDAALCA